MIDDAIRDAVRDVVRTELRAAVAELRAALGTIAPVALDVGEAAHVLRLSEATVRNLAERGDLQPIPHGLKRVQFSRAEVERFATEGPARRLRSAS